MSFYRLSHRQDSTYHSLSYNSCGMLAGTRNSSKGIFRLSFKKNIYIPIQNIFIFRDLNWTVFFLYKSESLYLLIFYDYIVVCFQFYYFTEL